MEPDGELVRPTAMIRILGACLILFLAACGTPGAAGAGPEPGHPLAGRSFGSTTVTGHQLVKGTVVTLRFSRDGRLAARGGCNLLNGDFSLEGGALVVGEIMQTDMGCDPLRLAQDEWLGDFLRNRPTWRLSGRELVLRTGGDEIRLAETPEPTLSTSGDPDGTTSTMAPSGPAPR
jgi:heat shock protein HslJ